MARESLPQRRESCDYWRKCVIRSNVQRMGCALGLIRSLWQAVRLLFSIVSKFIHIYEIEKEKEK